MLCSRFPYPLEKGDKLRIFHQIEGLSTVSDVTLIALTEKKVSSAHRKVVEAMVKECHIIRIPKIKRNWSIVKAVNSGLPLSIAHYYSESAATQIEAIIQKIQPDHIYCQLTRMSEYVRHIKGIPKTIDYMDAFAVSMRKRAEIGDGISKWVYRLEAERLKKYEAEVYGDFDHHTIISEQDRVALELPENAHVDVIPNGVDTNFFTPDVKKTKAKYDIGFIGNMGYLPNIQAAEYLVQNILPQLSSKTTILLGGARPHPRVKQLSSDRVTVSGWMEDIRDAYAACRIVVAPIWSGTGQQNKILESMAMGIPCVTTPPVHKAIGGKHREHLMIAEDGEAFIACIQELLENQLLYEHISQEGLTFVRENYSWENSHQLLNQVLGIKPHKNL